MIDRIIHNINKRRAAKHVSLPCTGVYYAYVPRHFSCNKMVDFWFSLCNNLFCRTKGHEVDADALALMNHSHQFGAWAP